MLRKISKILCKVILLYLVYALICNTLVFMIHRPDAEGYAQSIDPDRFLGHSTGPDRVALIEDRLESGATRLQLIDEATQRIEIAYHAVHEGFSSDLFYGALLDAAQRGVSVSLLVDGLFHNLRGRGKDTLWALIEHPEVTVRFFESPDPIRPWSFNHRLHDKFMLVDGTYAMIGGRNIGDKYFLESYSGSVVHDRDVVIHLSQPERFEDSVLLQFEAYFQRLWQHEYTTCQQKTLSERQRTRAATRLEALLQAIAATRKENPQHFPPELASLDRSVSTRKVTLITNPLTRLNKEPWILMEMNALFEQAKEHVWLQSPYIIPTSKMEHYVTLQRPQAPMTALTNSPAVSPNPFAIAGYLNEKDDLLELFGSLHEFHGDGSLHAKSYVVDDRISLVGSFNLDARSAFLSTESMVVIDSQPFAQDMLAAKEALIDQSVPAGQEELSGTGAIEPQEMPWLKSILIRVMRVIVYPLADLL